MMKERTLFYYEKDPVAQIRRSQLVILVLSVLLALVLLNSAYNFVDLSVSGARGFVIAVALLVLLEAVFAAITFTMSFRRKRK